MSFEQVLLSVMRVESQMSASHVFIVHLQSGLRKLYHGMSQRGGELSPDVLRGRVRYEVFCAKMYKTVFRRKMQLDWSHRREQCITRAAKLLDLDSAHRRFYFITLQEKKTPCLIEE